MSAAHSSPCSPPRVLPVRAITRTPTAGRFPDGVQVMDSALDALTGASAVFLNSRALGEQLADVVAVGPRHSGVRKLVALSAINADDDFSRQPSRVRGDRNKEVEQLCVDSGLAWVSLRPAVFATNFVGMWSAQIQAGDVVGGPYADASSAPIVEADIAAVAAHALSTDELVGQRIPLTGPQAFTNTELVEHHRHRPGPSAALRRGPTRRRAAALHRYGAGRRIRRRLHGHARRCRRQAGSGHQRGREDHRPTGDHFRPMGFGSPRPLHELVLLEKPGRLDMSDPRPPRYLKPMNKVMLAVQKLGIPTGPAMVLTVPRPQVRTTTQHPDDAVPVQRRPLRRRRLPRGRIGPPTPGRPAPARSAGAAARNGSRSSN